MSEEGPDFCKAGAKQQQDNLFLKILNLVSSKVLWFCTQWLCCSVRHSESQKKARLVLRNPVAGFTNKPFSYISFLRTFQDASMLTP